MAAPAAPTGLTLSKVTNVTDGTDQLYASWTDNASGAAKFAVRYKEFNDAGPYNLIITEVAATNILIEGLSAIATPGSTFRVCVSAVDPGDSSESALICDTESTTAADVFGAAALTGTGTLAAAGVPTAFGVAALTGAGASTIVGTPTAFGVAALAGTGSLTAAGLPTEDAWKPHRRHPSNRHRARAHSLKRDWWRYR